MEGLFFLVDIILMLLLGFSIFRAERKPPPGSLGIFSYKSDFERDGKAEEDERHA